MNLVRVIYKFINNISSYFQRRFAGQRKITSNSKSSDDTLIEVESQERGNIKVPAKISVEDEPEESQINEISLAKRTLMTKLYMIEQEIEVFKNDFPTEYSYFLSSIERLRETYQSSLEDSKNKVTFEIDPEVNGRLNWEIEELEKEIKQFIDGTVKFNILSKRLQILVAKLNILYNVSINHPNEKEKVMSQLDRVFGIGAEIVEDLKENEYILDDVRLRDRIITLISYADYHIFKIALRNSDITPESIIRKLVLFRAFKDFDYSAAFKAFIEDELSDLGELLPLIDNEDCRKIFDKKIATLLNEISSDVNVKVLLLNEAFWRKVFELESNIIEMLKSCNIKENKKIKIKLISRMDINVDEKEVLTLPKTNAYLALVSIFSTTHDDRIWLLIKLIKSLSDEISYKEIYLLALLFDAIDMIQSIPNSLKNYIEKYRKRYPYNRESIINKKVCVLNSQEEKVYTRLFPLDEDADSVIETLQNLKIDFEVTSDSININSFYFKGLEKMFPNKIAIQATDETVAV